MKTQNSEIEIFTFNIVSPFLTEILLVSVKDRTVNTNGIAVSTWQLWDTTVSKFFRVFPRGKWKFCP